MEIKKIEFVQSVDDWRKCPETQLPEYAFIGRSNVGKSSLVNMLGNNKSLAKTSSKPGKTQTINHFIVNNKWYLVDLPGYGYATISKTMREMWIRMIEDYFVNRKNLQAVFVLVDARIEPQNNDIEFVNNLGELGIPFSIIFTKTDKISKMKLQENVKNFSDKMLEYWEELPPFFITSAHKNIGRDEILNYIDEINKQIDENTEIL
ncbi:ribosome biogenesis GTP-binding protein YihA/YsxC [Bacteroidales bacterium OttesenSCG-928-E04]|nr:ribosome biogenesis GTP-binding protein YihA/YsxC [Bacteroidales bacterium OttesenSCG-928-E04]MDL2326491.1 ribosome biogenesis GTP-binding protein YihA/YsxC [Bacteroidales bacterium OttesenSCG-928-A14]